MLINFLLLAPQIVCTRDTAGCQRRLDASFSFESLTGSWLIRFTNTSTIIPESLARSCILYSRSRLFSSRFCSFHCAAVTARQFNFTSTSARLVASFLSFSQTSFIACAEFNSCPNVIDAKLIRGTISLIDGSCGSS